MNKIIEALREGMKQKLVIAKESTTVIPMQSSLSITVPIPSNALLLKSIEVTANKQIPFRVQFFEEATMTNSRYNSGNVTGENYDVLDLPYIDQDGTQSMHFFIENISDFEASFTIEVRGVSMK